MAEEKKKKGFFRRIFGGEEDAPPEEEQPVEGAETAEAESEEPAESEAPEMQEAPEEPRALDAETVAAPSVTDDEPPAELPTEAIAAPPVEPVMPPELEAEKPPVEEIEETASQEPEPAAEETATEDKPKKSGLLGRLRNRLGKTRQGMTDKVRDLMYLHAKVDEELIEDIETILLQADVGLETTEKIVGKLKSKADAKKADTPEALIAIFKESLQEVLQREKAEIAFAPQPPTVLLVVGVNGVGKTTTIGKMALEYKRQGKDVMLVAGDTFRAAAVEQLTIWAERTGAKLVKREMGADPAAVCYEALDSPEGRAVDVVLIDTAGRLHTKSHLMEELRKVHRVIKKVHPEAPHETLLILDATTGQNAIQQAKIFTETVDCSGLIMTKLDGTAKGGVLVGLCDRFDLPVYKIGIGEGEEDLRDFDAAQFVEALFATSVPAPDGDAGQR